MKILITGMNKNQCTKDFYLRQQLKVIPSHYSLIRCLEDMGHTVEQRQVELGESLDQYDRIICFLASPRQLVAVTFYQGLWAVHQARQDQLILAFDDWQTKGIMDGLTVCTDTEKLFAKFILGVNNVELSDVEKYEKQFIEGINKIGEKSAPVLLSVFCGGELDLLLDYPANLVYPYNPNPYHHNRGPHNREDIPFAEMNFMEQMNLETSSTPPKDKVKMFNFASLVQSKTKKWLKNQNIKSWDIEYFGSKKDGQRRLTEGDMTKVFDEQWGCLMPGYDHAGSGWWRARPLQVADAGSILIGDPDEMIIYYENQELADIKATDIENLSVKELSAIASAQKSHIYKYHPLDKAIQQSEINTCLKSSS